MTATTPPAPPSALSPSAEPQIYVGIISSILVSAGLVTTGEATSLQPLLLAVIVVLPTVLAIIQRQFATPNAKVAVAVQQAVAAATTSTPPVAPATPKLGGITTVSGDITSIVTPLTTVEHGTVPQGTRRFEATSPFSELDTPSGGGFLFDATVSIDNPGHTPHGTFLRVASSTPWLFPASAVTLDSMASAPTTMGTPSVTNPSTGQVSYLGSPDAPPPGLTVAGWLAGPSRDTYGYFMQILYIDAHPDAPVPATFPAEATQANVRPFAIAQFGIEVLGSLTGYPPLSVAIVDKVALDMLACEQSLGQQADGSGIPHVIWSDSQWRMVGGRTRAIAISGQTAGPPA